jgi:PAS domain S-box-containing protein
MRSLKDDTPSRSVNSTRHFFSSLRFRLLLLILVPVVPALGMMLYTAAVWRGHEADEAQANALRLAGQAAAGHERLIAEGRKLLVGLAQHPAVRGGDADQCSRSLLAVWQQSSHYANLGVIKPNGEVLCSALAVPEGTRLGDRPYFQRAVELRDFAVGDYQVGRITGVATVNFAYPVVDQSDRIQAVAFAALKLTSLSELATESHLPPGTSVTLMDQGGTILARYPDPQTFIGRSALDTPIFRFMRTQQQEGTAELTDLDGIRRLFGFRPLLDSPGAGNIYLAVGIPTVFAFAESSRIRARNLSVLGLGVLLTLLAAWVSSDVFLLRRVKALARVTTALSLGDLSTRTGISHEAGELGDLARAFDNMAATLEFRQKEILRQNQALAYLERRFRGLIENSTDGIVVLNRERVILYASPAITRTLGYAEMELVGCDASEITHVDDREAANARFTQLLQDPTGISTVQYRVRHKDGSWKWIEAVFSNLLADPSVQGIVANYRDITERKQAEDALSRANEELEIQVQKRTAQLVRANEALEAGLVEQDRAQETLRKLSSAVERAADSVFIANRDGLIEYVNPAFEALTGYTREEVTGKTRRILKSGEHDQQFYEHLWERLLSGEVYRGVFVNRKKDGELYYEEVNITPLRNGRGDVSHFVATGRDITQRIRTEEALRRLNERLEKEAERIGNLLHDEAGQFLTAAHITLAEVARDLPPLARGHLQEVRQHLDQVEKRLRTLSHELRPRVLEDLGLIAALEFLAEGVAKRTGIRITVNASPDEQLSPMAEVTLYRFAQEALTNASKHAGATQVTILLEQSVGSFRCAICDDGVGFDVSAVLARRDDPGLGLRGIQDRVVALGGTFQIVSAPGRGTKLLATIPVETEDAPPNLLG